MSTPDGGPAYPCKLSNVHADYENHTGMSYRQWLVGKIIGGMYASGDLMAALNITAAHEKQDPRDTAALVAKNQADAIIKALAE